MALPPRPRAPLTPLDRRRARARQGRAAIELAGAGAGVATALMLTSKPAAVLVALAAFFSALVAIAACLPVED